MKALPFKLRHGEKSSIKVDYELLEQFYPHYHTHEELQLTHILKSDGIAYIGDRIIEYNQGDIFLIGKKLPHVFKHDAERYQQVESISIFFHDDFLGAAFLGIPESKKIAQLFKDASRGIRLSGASAEPLWPETNRIKDLSGMARILNLLTILEFLSQSEPEFITGPDYHRPKRQVDGEKINAVFNYLTANYHQDISLAQVADTAHMSPTAFCRYFKQHTRKSYSRFLNEIRVNQACKLLQEDSLSISQVAYRTGFNNISNFNRQFKKITGKTPSAYQKMSL